MRTVSAWLVVLVVFAMVLQQCRAAREILGGPEPVMPAGKEGLGILCEQSDTVRTVLIQGVETLIRSQGERYETTLTLYAVKDSLVYISAVNSGFELIRAAVDPDSIVIVDRLNRVVYRTPVKKRFGYQNPVGFTDVMRLLSTYFLCREADLATEVDFSRLVFTFPDPHIKKQIVLSSDSLKTQSFEYFHAETKKYVTGERTPGGIRLFSNFIFPDLEVVATGGTLTYNRDIPVRMNINPRRYNVINF